MKLVGFAPKGESKNKMPVTRNDLVKKTVSWVDLRQDLLLLDHLE